MVTGVGECVRAHACARACVAACECKPVLCLKCMTGVATMLCCLSRASTIGTPTMATSSKDPSRCLQDLWSWTLWSLSVPISMQQLLCWSLFVLLSEWLSLLKCSHNVPATNSFFSTRGAIVLPVVGLLLPGSSPSRERAAGKWEPYQGLVDSAPLLVSCLCPPHAGPSRLQPRWAIDILHVRCYL